MGTLQHSGLRLSASGHLPGRLLALDTNDDRLRPFAALNGMPFTEGLRTLMRGLHLEKPEGITLPPITRALYGYFGYGMASFFNKKLENCLPQKDADASLVLPGTVLVFDHLYNRLCQISLGEHRDVNGARTRECGAALPFIGEDAVTATPGREGYMDAVNKIKQMLRQGEAIQVVPSCRFSTPFEGDAFTLYRRMRRCNASPYMFFMDLPGITLFGSSPEVMVRCDEGKLQLSPIAGPANAEPTISKTPASPQSCRKIPRNAPSTSCWWIWAATTSGA